MKAIKILFFLTTIIFLNSCYQDKGDFLRIYGIEISVDISEVSLDKTVNFTVKTDYGLDVTNEAKIFIQDIASSNLPIENGTSLTSSTNKIFKVYAEYPNPNDKTKILRSNEITVKFDEFAQSFVKRVLIEDYTGTWCVNCPTVSYAIEKLKEQTDKAVPVAIHRGSNSASFDPFHFEDANALENLVGVANQYPTAKLNRLTSWKYPQHTQNNLDTAIKLTTGTPVRLGLAINSTLSGNSINLDVKVKFFQDYSNLKLVVYVLENKLIYPQDNGTSFYGGIPVIEDFEHNHVLKATFTNILGDAIPSSETSYDKTYSRNFSVAVPSNITNTANIEFVAFVVGQDNKAINVRKAAIGENQPFEENN